MAITLSKGPCSSCGSKDNLVEFLGFDGQPIQKCFTEGCTLPHRVGEGKPKEIALPSSLVQGRTIALEKRKISTETCDRFSVQCGDYQGLQAIIFNYYDSDKNIISQKLRTSKVKGLWVNRQNDVTFFGQQNWTPHENTSIIVTEGELDCLSIYEVLGEQQAVISIADGAGAQTKEEFKRNLRWLGAWGKVILCFDNDIAGKGALEEVASLLSPEKVFQIEFPLKDANEMLTENRGRELRQIALTPKQWVPKCIVKGKDITIESLLIADKRGYAFPYPILDETLRGLKAGRLYVLTAASGGGKSTFAREVVSHLLTNYENTVIGNIYLEDTLQTSVMVYYAILNNLPLFEVLEHPEKQDKGQLNDFYTKYLQTNRLIYTNIEYSGLKTETLINTLDYMVKVNGCKVIVLDHISMLAVGTGNGKLSERQEIDILMQALRQWVNKSKVALLTICHLNRAEGDKGYEDGKAVNCQALRSSHSIAQLADVVIALERDILGSPSTSVKLKILKNRITGKTGYTDQLAYMEKEGRLVSIDEYFKRSQL